MTIIRTIHNRENPYVQLNKKALWDPNLSLTAVGLWARCMSRPDDWTFCIKELTHQFKEGRDAILAAINELIENGYAIRGQKVAVSTTSKKSGKRMVFQPVNYLFFEFKLSDEEKVKYTSDFQKMFPQPDFQGTESPGTENPHLLNTDNTKEQEKTNIDDEPAQAGGVEPPKKKLFFRHQSKNVVSKDLDEIYRYLRSKGFFETEIEEAIREADECNPVLKADNFNVIERYLASMIEKTRELKLKEKRKNDTKHTTRTHNREQDSLQRSRESFTKQIDALGPEARRPGVWSLDG